MASEKRTISIPTEMYDRLVRVAKKEKSDPTNPQYPIRAFFMFTERGKGSPIEVKEMGEVPVDVIKSSSESGPIFRWDIADKDRETYYPPETEDLRYSGTTLIQPNLELTHHYAYYMAIDFGHWGGFNINLWVENDEPVYNAFFVSGSRTDGEFFDCEIEPFDQKQLSEF